MYTFYTELIWQQISPACMEQEANPLASVCWRFLLLIKHNMMNVCMNAGEKRQRGEMWRSVVSRAWGRQWKQTVCSREEAIWCDQALFVLLSCCYYHTAEAQHHVIQAFFTLGFMLRSLNVSVLAWVHANTKVAPPPCRNLDSSQISWTLYSQWSHRIYTHTNSNNIELYTGDVCVSYDTKRKSWLLVPKPNEALK